MFAKSGSFKFTKIAVSKTLMTNLKNFLRAAGWNNFKRAPILQIC